MRHIVQVLDFGSAITGGYTATVLDNEGVLWFGREVQLSERREFKWTRAELPALPGALRG